MKCEGMKRLRETVSSFCGFKNQGKAAVLLLENKEIWFYFGGLL